MRSLLFLTLLATAASAQTKAPAAPSNLRLTCLGVNSVLFEWKDNSDNEKGFEIWLSIDYAKPTRYQVIPTANATSQVIVLGDLPGRLINGRVLAYNGATGAEVKSKLTSKVSVETPWEVTFGKPTGLTATAGNDSSIVLAWKDPSNSEQAYEIQNRKKSTKKWESIGTVNPMAKYRITAYSLLPETEYEFRVRGLKNGGTMASKFSNTADAKTLAFQSPTKLVVTPAAEGSFEFSWKDNSGLEEGHVIESKTGTATYASIGEVGANVTKVDPVPGFAYRTNYSFRVRAFRTVSGSRVYTGYTNEVSVLSKPLAAPTDFALTSIEANTAAFSWKDHSGKETGYTLQYRVAGKKKYKTLGTTAANATTFATKELAAGTNYEFRLRATTADSASKFSKVIAGETKDGIISSLHPEIFYGTSFNHEIRVSRPTRLASLTVGQLPAGLAYSSTTHRITGTPTKDNLVKSTVTARFKDGTTDVRKLAFRIVRPPVPPVAHGSFGAATVAVGGETSVSLTGRFTDPDVTLARRVTTTKGTFDVILYPKPTPLTVQNFLAYADGGKYAKTFFHRSVADFVVQGGGFKVDGTTYSKVAVNDPVANEPGISNKAGTVAMAKLGGDPNSATSQWFVSVADNSANLDAQNGGFTVFGRVTAAGLELMRSINDLPVADYKIPIGTGTENLDDVPVDAALAPALPDPTKFVKVTSVAPVEPLRYEVVSANPAVATAAITGGSIRITGVAVGTSQITIKAVDLDGAEVSRKFTVTVGAP